MTLGLADRQGDLLDDLNRFCDQGLGENSVYAVLHRERDRLFPDEMFADLFSYRGRRSVPPSVVATVMVLQRLEGLSDREAVERYAFDARWRYAAGVGGYDCGGWGRFAHTVLAPTRARLAASDDPRRIFHVTVQAASQAGLVGAKRVLDSTPLYDAVATMDTITLIRSGIRGLLRVAGELEAELRAVLKSGDDYASTAKPQIDWDCPDAREELIDSRAKDGYAAATSVTRPRPRTSSRMSPTRPAAPTRPAICQFRTPRPSTMLTTGALTTTALPMRAGQAVTCRAPALLSGAAVVVVAGAASSHVATPQRRRPLLAEPRLARPPVKPLVRPSSPRARAAKPVVTPTLQISGRRSTVMPPTAPASSWITLPVTGLALVARPSHQSPHAGCFPKPCPRSTSTPTPSPAQAR